VTVAAGTDLKVRFHMVSDAGAAGRAPGGGLTPRSTGVRATGRAAGAPLRFFFVTTARVIVYTVRSAPRDDIEARYPVHVRARLAKEE